MALQCGNKLPLNFQPITGNLPYNYYEMYKTKLLSKITLGIYVLFLLWLVLFKFSSNPISVLSNYQTRSLNLIPFAGTTQANFYQIIYNFIFFIPLGLLLSVNLKRTDFWRKLVYICAFSIAIEITQYIFAIGRTDITDVITNTLGGLIGLSLYETVTKRIESEKLDQFVTVIGTVLLIIFLLLRTLVFRVRYHSH
jgi:glycopeptide antibiotics resistance protein